ncbi:MAG TPA: sigma-70 family RNA polymerase sigma factor [Chthonomonadaceae bacterium]|nr:sigma-70 family RNA polymerase sigma factor [Chthonomonadaceae bacterium]
MNANITDNITPLRPLTAGRYRTPEVEAQIREALPLHLTQLATTIHRTNAPGEHAIKEEVLVYLLRHFQREGRPHDANVVAEEITARTNRFIAAWVDKGLPGVAVLHRERCVEDIYLEMWTALQSDAPGYEFWEIAFWMCLKRRAANAAKQARRSAYQEAPMVYMSGDTGEEMSLLDRMPDRSAQDTQSRIELQDALNRLPDDQRTAVFLFYHESWSQQQIAAQFGVSDRTIRNWLSAAMHTLRDYYGVRA